MLTKTVCPTTPGKLLQVTHQCAVWAPWTLSQRKEMCAHSVHQTKVFKTAWCSRKPREGATITVGEGRLLLLSGAWVLCAPHSLQCRALTGPPSCTQAELICRKSYECFLKQEKSPASSSCPRKPQRHPDASFPSLEMSSTARSRVKHPSSADYPGSSETCLSALAFKYKVEGWMSQMPKLLLITCKY